VVTQNTPLVSGMIDVPPFDRDALVAALRADQAGKTTFPEFLAASWRAGVVRYDVNFVARTVCYFGAHGEEYVEAYPAVEVSWVNGLIIAPSLGRQSGRLQASRW
jgi:uncharacterized protein YbcV (DUF1398 family)